MKKLFRNKVNRKENYPDKDSKKVIIPSYYNHAYIAPPEYEGSGIIEKLVDGFSERCFDYLKKAENFDQDNGSCKDAWIDSMVELSIREVLRERVEHKRLICLPLEEMYEGDLIFEQERLDDLIKERMEIEKKLETIDKIYHHGTIYENVMGGRNNG